MFHSTRMHKGKGGAQVLHEHTWDHPICRFSPQPSLGWVWRPPALGDGPRKEELLGKAHLSEVCPPARPPSAGNAAKAWVFLLGPSPSSLGMDYSTGGISA